MESSWKIACAGFSMQITDYLQRFNAVEVQETFFDPPRERTLARWRRQVPENFVFTLRAWQLITHPSTYPGYKRIQRSLDLGDKERFGSFLPTEEIKWAWDIVRKSAEILNARAILFHTPASFTPTQKNRENLIRFFSSIQRGPCQLVWQSEGLWEEEDVETICKDLDLIAAVDPLISTLSAGKAFYFRMPKKTYRKGNYSQEDFYRIYTRGEAWGGGDEPEGFLVWDSPNAAHDGYRFKQWFSEFERGD